MRHAISSTLDQAVPFAPPVAAPKVGLLDQVRAALRLRHYSYRTESSYVAWIKRFILFHGKRHTGDVGGAEVTVFLSHLAIDGKVAASTLNQALATILFPFRKALTVDS